MRGRLLTDAMEGPPCRTHVVLDPWPHIPGSCPMSTPRELLPQLLYVPGAAGALLSANIV